MTIEPNLDFLIIFAPLVMRIQVLVEKFSNNSSVVIIYGKLRSELTFENFCQCPNVDVYRDPRREILQKVSSNSQYIWQIEQRSDF